MNATTLIKAATSTEEVEKEINDGVLKSLRNAINRAKKNLQLVEAANLTEVFISKGGNFKQAKTTNKEFECKVSVSFKTKNTMLNDLVVASLNKMGGLVDTTKVDGSRVQVFGLSKNDRDVFMEKMADVPGVAVVAL